MSVWEEDPTTFSGLKCNFHPHCPWCKLPMELFDIKLLHFSINDGTPDLNSNAIDVNLYCLKCGYKDVFGVAISVEHGKRMKDTLLKGIENKEFNHVVHEEKATN
jgi:hypothetical protein